MIAGPDGKPFKGLIGNGSVCNIKCFGYRNQDEQLVVQLQMIKVVDLVEYEAAEGAGSLQDDLLGIDMSYEDAFGPKESSADGSEQEASAKPVDDEPPFDFDDEMDF